MVPLSLLQGLGQEGPVRKGPHPMEGPVKKEELGRMEDYWLFRDHNNRFKVRLSSDSIL